MPKGARACPECGSDEQTGWSEAAQTGGLDLPDETFDYDEFVKREFTPEGPIRRGLHWIWWVVAIIVLGILLRGWLR